MKYILAFIIGFTIGMANNANGAMLDLNAVPRVETPITMVVRKCEADGYFIYGGKIFMCLMVTEGVKRADLEAYNVKETVRRREAYKQRQSYIKNKQVDQKP